MAENKENIEKRIARYEHKLRQVDVWAVRRKERYNRKLNELKEKLLSVKK